MFLLIYRWFQKHLDSPYQKPLSTVKFERLRDPCLISFTPKWGEKRFVPSSYLLLNPFFFFLKNLHACTVLIYLHIRHSLIIFSVVIEERYYAV